MRKLLIPAFIMLSYSSNAQEAKTETPICLPLTKMMEIVTSVGFVPILKSSDEKITTLVMVQPDKKSLAVIVFDATAKTVEESAACLATMQDNLQLNDKALEELMTKMVGTKT